jgi:hypothetical protein
MRSVRGLWVGRVCWALVMQACSTRDLAHLICIRYSDAPVWVLRSCLYISQVLTLSNLSTAYNSADVSAHLAVAAGLVIPPAISSDVDYRLISLILTQLLLWLQLYSATAVHESRLVEFHTTLETGAQRYKLSAWLPLLAMGVPFWGEGTLTLLLLAISTLDRHRRIWVAVVRIYLLMFVSCRSASKSKYL